MPEMLPVRTVRVVFTYVIAAGRDGCPALVRYAVAGQGAGVRVPLTPRGRPRRCEGDRHEGSYSVGYSGADGSGADGRAGHESGASRSGRSEYGDSPCRARSWAG